MQVNYIAKTEEGKKALINWLDNNKEYSKINEEPLVITEQYKDSSVDYMFKNMEKRLKLPKGTISLNSVLINSLNKSLLKKATKKLKVAKSDIEVQVINNG